MSILVIDCETNGLFDFKQPADAPGQPRLAHLAMIFTDADGDVLWREDFYIKPDGWSMTAEASAINGLTDDFLAANGVPIAQALIAYCATIRSGAVVVAFNAQYDTKVMRGELRRLGWPDLFEQTPNICVMRPMTALCRIPNPNRGGLKFPNLTEALEHFGHAFDGAHRAINDAEGARLIYRELKARDLLPEARVHYAKEKPEKAAPAPRRRRQAVGANEMF